jgi:hypothetical protein
MVATGTKRKLNLAALDLPLRPADLDMQYFFDVYYSWPVEKRARKLRHFKSMSEERERNKVHVTHLRQRMSEFGRSHPEVFARYERELCALERECNYWSGRPSPKENNETEAMIDWDRHMVETFEMADAQLGVQAAELREDARKAKLSVVNRPCIHTPLDEAIRVLVEDGKHAAACARGESNPDAEFNVLQTARAAEAYSHDECLKQESTEKRIEQAAMMMDLTVFKCVAIRDLSQHVLRSALDVRIAADTAPWFRYFFTDYKD